MKGTPKLSTTANGKPMHYSVGALISQKGKYLLLDRTSPPFGWAGPAGHVDEEEDVLSALKREVKEETGYDLKNSKLLYEEEVQNNVCAKGITVHYWYVYDGKVGGVSHRSMRETKAMGWFSKEEIKKLKLEPVWEYWLKKKKVL